MRGWKDGWAVDVWMARRTDGGLDGSGWWIRQGGGWMTGGQMAKWTDGGMAGRWLMVEGWMDGGAWVGEWTVA